MNKGKKSQNQTIISKPWNNHEQVSRHGRLVRSQLQARETAGSDNTQTSHAIQNQYASCHPHGSEEVSPSVKAQAGLLQKMTNDFQEEQRMWNWQCNFEKQNSHTAWPLELMQIQSPRQHICHWGPMWSESQWTDFRYHYTDTSNFSAHAMRGRGRKLIFTNGVNSLLSVCVRASADCPSDPGSLRRQFSVYAGKRLSRWG